MDSMKSMRWTLYTTGGILILLGVLSFFYPAASLLSLALFLGIGFIVAGINHLVPYFSMKGDPLRPGWLLPQGILDLLTGVLMLTRLGLTAFMIPVLLGIWMFFMGGLRIVAAFRIRRARIRRWWMMLVSGVLTLLCAFLVASSPILGAAMVTALIGGAFIFAGALTIAEGRFVFGGNRS